MSSFLKAGVLGYGRLGAEVAARLERGLPGLRLTWIGEPLEERRELAAKTHSGIQIGNGWLQAPEDLGALVICSSPREQGTPAESFLKRGCAVITAPPLASNATALERLRSVSLDSGSLFLPLRLVTRHPAWEAFAAAFRELDGVRLLDMRMATFGPFSADLSVHRAQAGWILPSVLDLVGRRPSEVGVLGTSGMGGGPADLGALTISFEGDFEMMFSLTRLSPEQGLKVLALGERRMVEFYSNLGSFAEARLHPRRVHFEEGVAWTSPDSGPRILASEEVDCVSAGLLAAAKALQSGEEQDLSGDLLSERILDAAWASARLGGSRVRLPDSLTRI